MSTFSTDPTEPVEPAGSEADRAEQEAAVTAGDRIAFVLPDDPEVPLADAWEGSIPAGDDEDDRSHDG